MKQEPNQGSAGEMMIVGLIDHADILGKSAQETQRALTKQIQELTHLQQWTVNAALELQTRAATAIQNLEAERGKLQNTRANLEQCARQAIHDAVRLQSGDIEQQTVRAFATPLRDIQQAADQVRQNIKEMKWFTIGLVLLAGIVIGQMTGWWPVRSNQNNMREQLNRIEQYLAALPQPAAAVTPDPHGPSHKGKAK